MAVAAVTRPLSDIDLRAQIEALQPGDSFSLDRPLTVEEFCDYVSDEWAAELIDGVIYLTTPPSDAQEDLAGWLLTVARPFAEARGLGRVRGGRSGVRIDDTSLREPDLL